MTAEIYLRRSLFTPIIIPVLAGLSLVTNGSRGVSSAGGGTGHIAESVAIFLVTSLCLGGIPYLWMLYARREFFRSADGAELVSAWRQLPLEMIPYYGKFWGALTLLLLVTIWGAMYGVVFLIAGTIAIPVLGYLYVGITFGFLWIFQCLGLVEKGTT